MLISLHHTYRGRTHRWWIQSTMILALLTFLFFLTYYYLNLYTQFQLLRAEHKRLQPYISITQSDTLNYRKRSSTLTRVNHAHQYLEYLNKFERFEKKAKLAKWMRVYHSKQVLYRQKNDLEQVLIGDMVAPVMTSLWKDLFVYSQQWDSASFSEKNKMQATFKQTILVYELLSKHHGYKILSSDWMRQTIIQSWYTFMLNESDEQMATKTATLPSYQQIYQKLDSLVEFYFQMPNLGNTWVKSDRALLEKTKNQLNLNKDTDTLIS